MQQPIIHVTYSRAFDDIEALLKSLRILFHVLAADKNLDRDFAPPQRLKVFGWNIYKSVQML